MSNQMWLPVITETWDVPGQGTEVPPKVRIYDRVAERLTSELSAH